MVVTNSLNSRHARRNALARAHPGWTLRKIEAALGPPKGSPPSEAPPKTSRKAYTRNNKSLPQNQLRKPIPTDEEFKAAYLACPNVYKIIEANGWSEHYCVRLRKRLGLEHPRVIPEASRDAIRQWFAQGAPTPLKVLAQSLGINPSSVRKFAKTQGLYNEEIDRKLRSYGGRPLGSEPRRGSRPMDQRGAGAAGD